MKNNITVSVCMITYNHEQFISQAIEGILMQKTDFPIELIIGEDCSTDSTRQICTEYQEKYPDKINLQLRKNNLGFYQNWAVTLQACTGKYIALCEGDDYWTDPLKLQKQVDFLEANPDYSVCSHLYSCYNENKKETFINKKFSFVNDKIGETGIDVDNKLNLAVSLFRTLTIVFRNQLDYSETILQHKKPMDFHLFYYLLEKGKGYFMFFNGAIYRIHDTGVFMSKSALDANFLFYYNRVDVYFYNKRDKDLRTSYLWANRQLLECFCTEFRKNFRSKKLQSLYRDYLKWEFRCLRFVFPFFHSFWILRKLCKWLFVRESENI